MPPVQQGQLALQGGLVPQVLREPMVILAQLERWGPPAQMVWWVQQVPEAILDPLARRV